MDISSPKERLQKLLQLSKVIDKERELKKKMRIDQQVKILKDEGPGVGHYKPENANKIILGHNPEWSLPRSRND